MNKTIGIIGSVSPDIINFYFTEVKRLIFERYGNDSNINIVIKTINIATLNKLRAEAKWDQLMELTIKAAKCLQNAGANVILATNTSVLFGIDEHIKLKINLPVIKVTEEVVKNMLSKKYKKVLLLGTKYNMQGFLYKNLTQEFGINFLLPNEVEKEFIHNNIYNELTFGIITPKARKKYLMIIDKFVKEEKIDAVVFGTTEISYILNQDHLKTPLVVPYLINIYKGLDLIEK